MKRPVLFLFFTAFSLFLISHKASAQELQCVQANGLVWCFNDQACGQACDDVCAVNGAEPIEDNGVWYQAQNTEEECRAISRAFGLGDDVALNSFTFGCLEDSAGFHNNLGVNPLNGPILCSIAQSCPQNHRTGMDHLGTPCGEESRRSICPCGPPAVPNYVPITAIIKPIPALAQWGLMAAAGVLGIAGFVYLRRKKAAA